MLQATRDPQRHGGAPARQRILVVDDHDVVHWGFRLLLSREPWVERCLSARSGDEACALAERYRPHVALVDLFTGRESGAEICERLRRCEPAPRVLLISGAGRISASATESAGASGFIPKEWPAQDILSAVRMVGLGMRVYQPQVVHGVVELSTREREVLELLCSGSTNREIAATLSLSPHTIKEYTSSVYRKLGARNRAEAVQRAERLGLGS